MPCSGLCQHRGSQYSPGIKEKSWLFPSGGFVCHVFISSGFIGEGVRKGSLKIHKRQVRINTQVFWNSSIISNIWKKFLPNLFSCSTFCFGQTWLFSKGGKIVLLKVFPSEGSTMGIVPTIFFGASLWFLTHFQEREAAVAVSRDHWWSVILIRNNQF